MAANDVLEYFRGLCHINKTIIVETKSLSINQFASYSRTFFKAASRVFPIEATVVN